MFWSLGRSDSYGTEIWLRTVQALTLMQETMEGGGGGKQEYLCARDLEMKRQSYLQCFVKFRIQRVLLHFRLSFPAL